MLLLISALFISRCARVGAPPGGPKDEDPPKVKKSTPENYSVNFDKKTIKVEFDEYVLLKEVNQKLIVSPPLEDKPNVKLKGKSMIIEIEEELHDSTTYTFNFNDAIVDNNESNPLADYQFVFSTGQVLDSLKYGGGIIDAFNLKVPEEVHVLMYDDLSDSVLYKKRPLYVSKADENGNFLIQNLKADTFQIFALQDANMNFLYEPEEFVAFSDSLIFLNPESQTEFVMFDSTNVVSDSLNVIPDSLDAMLKFSGEKLMLPLFQEEFKEQYVLNSSRTRKENILFVFNKPLSEDLEISLPEYSDKKDWFQQEKYTLGDSIGYWLTDTTLINQESIQIAFRYLVEFKPDSIKYVADTIRFRFKKPAKKTRRRNVQPEQKQSLALLMNIGPWNSIDVNGPVTISALTPISHFDVEKVQFYSIQDSVETKVEISPFKDSTKINRLLFQYKWDEEYSYKLQFLPEAVTDIYGLTNDSIKVNFQPRKLEYYGNIIMEMENIDKQLIIQLLTEKEVLIQQSLVSGDTTLSYTYLPPKTYIIKAIWDKNSNRKWDTGNLIKRIQPEKVSYYLEEIKLRSNWDFKKNWSPQFNEY